MDLRCQNIQREEIEGLPCRCAYIIQSRPIDYPSSIVVRRESQLDAIGKKNSIASLGCSNR